MPKLTEDLVAAIVVPEGKRDVLVFDDVVRGFGLRAYPGRSVYFVKFTVNSQPRRLTLGPVRRGNLEMMRKLAEKAKAHATLGEDIIGDKKAKEAEAKAAASAATIGALIEIFLRDREELTRKVRDGKPVVPTLRLRTHEQCTRYLESHCAPLHGLVAGTVTQGAQMGVVDLDKRWTPLNGLRIETVSRSHVVKVVDEVARTRGKVTADRCKTALSTFYVWAIDQGYCDSNPTLNIKARATHGSRERTLSNQELAAVWQACPGNDFGAIVKLLLLTGCRRQEIADLAWSELALAERVIKLPADRVKNKRAHAVWLSDQALAILGAIDRGDRPLVFGRGASGYGGWTISKTRLDKALGDMPHWTLHDLRRSFSTRTNELGLGEPWEVEACLNHTIGGTEGIYNKARFEAGKRKVWEAWGAHIDRLVLRPAVKASSPRVTKRGQVAIRSLNDSR